MFTATAKETCSSFSKALCYIICTNTSSEGEINKGLKEYKATPCAILVDIREPDEFKAGHIVKDGIMTVVPHSGNIISYETYRDAMIHMEWREPDMRQYEGQNRGNSGVYIHGVYELQVLDSWGVETPQDDDCGGIYKMHAPLMNACKPPLEWQTYDILFRAPRFGMDGEKTEDARVTVLQNGLPVLNNVIMPRVTPSGSRTFEAADGPLMLQDHCHPVSFRNIWIMKL